jgi:hypothetical protein
MATRSTIAVVHEDGTVSQIYCHYDGYLQHNGQMLLEYYNNTLAVEFLVSKGDLSVLAPRVSTTGSHSFDTPENGVCTLAVEFLVSKGDLSVLAPRVSTTGSHSFDTPENGVCIYYGRDRGETNTEPKTYASVSEYLDNFVPEEYNYLFNGTSWGYQAYSMTEYVEVTEELIEQEMA